MKEKPEDPERVIKSYFSFKVKSPFNHFTEIFEK